MVDSGGTEEGDLVGDDNVGGRFSLYHFLFLFFLLIGKRTVYMVLN